MRIGLNPNRDSIKLESDFFHQVVIPVYIPNQEDYFKDSFQILKLCLGSLFKTCHQKTYFTIVNNGSCDEVKDYFDKLFQDKMIHEIIQTSTIGKLNSILKGITGHKFQLITITDCDVLFLNDWQFQTYHIFNNFDKAGVVSPTPSPKILKHLTYNLIGANLFSNKLAFTKTKNPKALIKFAESIGNPNFYNNNHLEKNLTLNTKNIKAVVGSAHFVATYKGSIFDKINVKFTKFNLGGDSENLILDKPPVDQGFWRLSTEDNYAYHLGNVVEPWMFQVFDKIKIENELIIKAPIDKNLKINKFKINIVNPIFKKIISKNIFWKWFFKYKGLNKTVAKEY